MTRTPSQPPRSAEEIRQGFAEELARNYPYIWQRLLTQHVPDQTGRCRACRSANRGAPRWPCNLWEIADQARQLQANQSKQ